MSVKSNVMYFTGKGLASSLSADLCERRMTSFCAKARQRLVLPVPGGPCSRTSLDSGRREVGFAG